MLPIIGIKQVEKLGFWCVVSNNVEAAQRQDFVTSLANIGLKESMGGFFVS